MNHEISTIIRQSCIKTVKSRGKTKSGIILASAAQEKPQEAEVIAVGPGGVVDGKRSYHAGKKKDRRLFILNMPEQK